MHLINHSLKKSAAIAAAGTLMFSLFVSGGMVMAAPPPAPIILTAPNSTSTAPVTLTGTAEPNVQIRVLGWGGVTYPGTADASGNWSVVVDLQTDGPNLLTVTAVNAAGEVSPASTISIVPVIEEVEDTSPIPAAPIILTPPNNSTSTAPVTLTGTAEPNIHIEVAGWGGVSYPGTADASGNWSVIVDLQTDGPNLLSVTAVSATGKVSSSTMITIVPVREGADTSAPSAPVITSPTSPHSTSTSPITVVGTAEANSIVSVTGGSATASTTATAAGNFALPVFLNASTTNTLSFVATDASGNVSSPTTLIVTHTTSGTSTLDVTAPSAPIVLSPTTPSSTTTSPIIISGTAEASSTISVTGGNGLATTTTNGSGNFSLSVFLNGSTTSGTSTVNILNVFATDAAGNVSVGTPLLITLLGTTTGTTTNSTSSPIITLNGDVGVTAFICNGFTDLGATAVSSTGTPLTVTSSSTVDLNNPGTYTVTYTATDANGNTSTTTRTVVVRNCSSGGGGGSSDDDDDGEVLGSSSGDNSSSGNGTIPPFIGVTPPGGFTPFVAVSGFPGTTQVLGASFVPGLPTTGGGEEAFKFFLPILLSFGVVLLGLSIGRKKQSNLS